MVESRLEVLAGSLAAAAGSLAAAAGSLAGSLVAAAGSLAATEMSHHSTVYECHLGHGLLDAAAALGLAAMESVRQGLLMLAAGCGGSWCTLQYKDRKTDEHSAIEIHM
jgi:hypothetical protein